MPETVQAIETSSSLRTELSEDTLDQLKMAGEVQRNFLPAKLPDSDRIQWSTIFRPADWVSGDIYDVTRLDESRIGFYIADAVGHSMPAALLTMFLKQAITMRETTGNDYRIFEPVEVIETLNTRMTEQNLSGCLFATCCYCLLNTQTLQMSFARAGHPYPIIIRNNAHPEQLENRGGLLGIFENIDYEQQTVQLERGDKIVIYSDGCESMVGQCSDRGEFEFNDAFCELTKLPLKEMISGFEAMLENRKVPPDQIDDVTVLALEIL